MTEGSTSIVIDRPVDEVFAAISDVTRTGEWSPECIGCRWVGGATQAAKGATFEGDNKIAIGGMTLKKWTTTSKVSELVDGKVFEFVAEEYTTWRYELEPSGAGTKITESYRYTSKPGMQTFIYGTLLRRPAAMNKGMAKTLARLKAALESSH